MTILKDLILRYDAWIQSGGTRQSVADPLPWEEEEELEYVLIFKIMPWLNSFRLLAHTPLLTSKPITDGNLTLFGGDLWKRPNIPTLTLLR